MKKWGFLVALSVCFIAIVWLSIKDKKNTTHHTLVYIDYDIRNKNMIKSETTYIPKSNQHTTFKICQSRKGIAPCKEVKGVQHGTQKWYNKGILQYEDFYEHGNHTHTIAYYNNGLKRKECLYQNDKLLQTNLYGKSNGNPLTETIFYKNNEKIKKYYINNKIHKEEKYRDNKLVSRKIYDSDGLLQRLEEYNFIGNDANSLDNFFDELDSVNPFLFEQDTPDYLNKRYRYIPQQKNDNMQDNFWI